MPAQHRGMKSATLIAMFSVISLANAGTMPTEKSTQESGNAEKASYLVGSSLPGVMTRRSKVAYSTIAAAEASQSANGGEIVDFDKALLAAYTDIAGSVAMSRTTREERLKRMQSK
jgi:nitrous oxide reductase accessory protein NosL